MAKESIKKKIQKNITSALFAQTAAMLLSIVVPRLVLVNYGSEINGLINSLVQVYACLELLEAGVGTATLQALFSQYGVEKDNKASINRILSAASRYYTKAGLLYLGAVIILAAIYPLVVQTEIPWFTVTAIILMHGIPGASSFLVQAKFKLLLGVEGKSYVQNNISLLTRVLSNIAKIVLITLGYNVLVVQFALFILQMMQVVVYKIYEKQKYPWVDYHQSPDYQSLSQKNNVFIHQISGLIFSNTDLVILTLLCGLKMVSVYSMYSMVIGVVASFSGIISSSVHFYLGQSFHGDKIKYLKIHDIYETYYMGLGFALYTIFYILIIPFLGIYTRGVEDVQYIDRYLPMLFVIIKFLEGGRSSSLNALNFAQMFKETQHHALIEMILNIVISFGGAYFFGIYGVLIGTIIALLYRGHMMIWYADKKVLHRSCWITYRRWIVDFAVFAMIALGSKYIVFTINTYFDFVLYAVPISVCVIFIYFVVISLCERNVFMNIYNGIRYRYHYKD